MTILPGYASPEFMFQIKEVAKATFSRDDYDELKIFEKKKQDQNVTHDERTVHWDDDLFKGSYSLMKVNK